MKKIILGIIVLGLIGNNLYGQSNRVLLDSLIIRGNSYYNDDGSLFNGIGYRVWEFKRVREEGSIKNGKREGKWIFWYEKINEDINNKEFEKHYIDGVM